MKVIVVQKTPKLAALERSAPERVAQLQARDPRAYESMVAASEGQRVANARVAEALAAVGADTTCLDRDAFDVLDPDADLVVAVGGDGTVLDVSHKVVGVPLVGINSDPERSVGYFCADDADGAQAVFERFAGGDASSTSLHRIAMTVDGQAYPFPCMNDLLVTNRNPAMMSRYLVSTGGREERHSSSGMWISTPAGSTAGIRSAGGTVMPLDGALLQYLVREPYTTGDVRYPMLRGVRYLSEGFRVRSLMDGGAIYVDGPYIEIPFELGAEMALSEGPPIELVELDPLRRER